MDKIEQKDRKTGLVMRWVCQLIGLEGRKRYCLVAILVLKVTVWSHDWDRAIGFVCLSVCMFDWNLH